MEESGDNRLVLVCPLDWGLGHATRCVPLIRQLQQEGFSILLGGNGESLSLLKQEFPQYETVVLPGMRIRYGRGKRLWLMSALQFPKFLLQVISEHRAVKRICNFYKPQVIISDNRYGVWSRTAKNILITHQLHPFMPRGLGWARGMAAAFIGSISSAFQEIWIPDIPGKQNLSGELSDLSAGKFRIIRYKGILSRLKDVAVPETALPSPDIFVILSGPEPQRGIFEKMVYEKFAASPFKVYVLRGKPGAANSESGWQAVKGDRQMAKLFFINHLPADELAWYLQHSRLIIARTGYSTIMDLVQLKRSALLVPTPGQPEQEYLGSRMEELGIFAIISQDEFPVLEIQLPAMADATAEGTVFFMKDRVQVSMQAREEALRRFSSDFTETASSL
jgi:predicted glycosyltransferase